MKRITFLLTLILFAFCVMPAEITHLRYIQSTNNTSISEISRRPYPARANRMKNKKGIINILYDESMQVPDSMKRSIAAAAEMWELHIYNKEPINISFAYDKLPSNEVFEAAVTCDSKNGMLYPTSLLKQTVGLDNATEIDAMLFLNSDLDWNCGFDATASNMGYNTMTQALRGIAISLGFGSSIHPLKDSFYWEGISPTIFDSKLTYNGTFLSDIEQRTPEFATAVKSGKVYFSADDGGQYLMNSKDYTELNLLLFVDSPNSLMHYDCSESSFYQTIDQITTNILKEIGWSQNLFSDVLIKCSDLDQNGYGAAALTHTFEYESALPLSSIKWEYRLRKTDGSFSTISTSNSETFTIPSIQNSSDYYIDSNGNLSGIVTLFGKNPQGEPIAESYHLSLGLKPVIVAVRNIKEIPTGDYTFRMQFEVEYLGADYLNISVEEDGDSKIYQKKITEPIIAHVTTNEMYRFYYHWIDIIANNEYGKAIKTIEVPDTYASRGQDVKSQYFIKLLSPKFTYELTKDNTNAFGVLSYDVVTNYEGMVRMKINPGTNSLLQWQSLITIEDHPIYERFNIQHNMRSGGKVMATIPSENIESEILYVDDYLSESDRELISGIEDIALSDELGISFENNKLIISASALLKNIRVQIFDLNGKVIDSFNGSTNHLDLNLANIPHGIYIIKISTENQEIIKKIAL